MSDAAVVLVLNVGSSSLKWSLDGGGLEGEVSGIGRAGAGRVRTTDRGAPPEERARDVADHADAVRAAIDAIDRAAGARPLAVGHRIVHGGPSLFEPVRIDARVLAALRDAAPFAPLHVPAEIAAVEAVAARWAGVPQVACFDTAFHRTMPEVARRYALPDALDAAGVRKYGFHGLSYESIVDALRARGELDSRLVVAHLGSGASLCAIRDGASVDTTMGLTPMGGVVMGTRAGDLDPGVLVHLLAQRGYDAATLERLLDRESGLLGVSGTTADMRALLAARTQGDRRASLAVELFVYSVSKAAAAMAAALGGIDALVFTGGIGERSSVVRAMVCGGLEGLVGTSVDPARNERVPDDGRISRDGARCAVRVLATREEPTIARHVRALLGQRPGATA